MTRTRSISHAWLAAAIVATLGFLPAPAGAGEADDHAESAVVQAQEEAHEQAAEHAEKHDAHAGEHGAHGEHPKNGLLLFLGGTVETVEDETFFTIGVEYERQFADRWGGQLVVEHLNDFDAWVFVAPVGFRVVDKLWITAGPGLETEPRRVGLEGHAGGHEIDPHGEEHTEPHEEADGPFFLWRFGVNYGIHFNERWGVVPSFHLDLVREHGEWVKAWVFGVSLAYHF